MASKTDPGLLKFSEMNASTPFLRLPQEIKNEIFELVLGGWDVHVYRWGNELLYSPNLKAHAGISRRIFGLFQVCQQLYSEAQLVPMQKNVFIFEDLRALTMFIMRTPLASAIRHIHLQLYIGRYTNYREWRGAMTKISTCMKDLESLCLRIEDLTGGDWTYEQAMGVEDEVTNSILILERLPLKDVTIEQSCYQSFMEWTEAEKDAWLSHVRKKLLGQDKDGKEQTSPSAI